MANVFNPDMEMYSVSGSREQMDALYAKYENIIAQLSRGVVPAEIPWTDPRFQKLLLQFIGGMLRYKVDADKLAIIREVFGGK